MAKEARWTPFIVGALLFWNAGMSGFDKFVILVLWAVHLAVVWSRVFGEAYVKDKSAMNRIVTTSLVQERDININFVTIFFCWRV